MVLIKKQLEEHFATTQVNCQFVSKMTGYKRSIFEKQSLSEVKMGQGSPISERLHLKIVEQFQKNVPQRKRLWISHHLQYTISSEDSEKLEKSLCARNKANGQHWVLLIFVPSGGHCIKNRQNFVLEIIAWADEHFQKSLSVNTVHPAFHKCKLELYHAKNN